jgi:hypothetical protein
LSALLYSGVAMAQAAPPPLNPDIWWDQWPGGLTAHIKSNHNSGASCTYVSDGWYVRSFYLNAYATYDLVIFPAVRKFGNWDIVVRCDNNTETRTTYFY